MVDGQYQGAWLSFFPDFTMVLQDAYRKFVEVKTKLRKLGLIYGMIYLSRLRVDENDKTHNCDSPADALYFCKKFGKNATPSQSDTPVHSLQVYQLQIAQICSGRIDFLLCSTCSTHYFTAMLLLGKHRVCHARPPDDAIFGDLVECLTIHDSGLEAFTTPEVHTAH
ncbi:hypothetical protein NDU88_006652 [Pleurodeles waltl]|uniref:C2H2-type domain-containing protein n=1 Tax=Pleurodeles waltl TaxID=8319 RepID=A0AAV7WFA3_PLEWA|nr:hypothetical protein NDU88_006652 [Pleurodeles waltl]